MASYALLCAITIAEIEGDVRAFLEERGVNTVFMSLCNGTAQAKTLDLLGLEKTQKVMHYCVLGYSLARSIIKEMVIKLGLGMKGRGIAMLIPLQAVGGKSSLLSLTEGQTNQDEVNIMIEANFSLIMAVATKGSTELVMEAARKAGASGGTVLGGKGTNNAENSKFFGVSIASEKDVVLIVSKKDSKDEIMKAIMQDAGLQSSCQTVLFALPVTDIVGIARLTEEA